MYRISVRPSMSGVRREDYGGAGAHRAATGQSEPDRPARPAEPDQKLFSQILKASATIDEDMRLGILHSFEDAFGEN